MFALVPKTPRATVVAPLMLTSVEVAEPPLPSPLDIKRPASPELVAPTTIKTQNTERIM